MVLTYLQFHLLFLLPPLSVLAVSTVVRPRLERRRLHLGGLVVILALALLYTVPWDSYLIGRGVWFYGDGRVALRFLRVPLGEYLFMIVQSVVVALWLFQLDAPTATADMTTRDRLFGLAGGAALTLAGLAGLTGDATFYLGAILAWAGPVFALQWAVGWRYLLAVRRYVGLAAGLPVLYLCIADRVAIGMGIWTISDRFTTGVDILGLPVEEATFFLVTTLFVVQGLVLLPWVVDRWA
jgi:lycopene cyclase domain-containing protein